MHMAATAASTVDAYLASLPPDRRDAVAAVRAAILANLPAGYEEGMQYGMIGYYIPLARYPETYNGQPLGIAALASQKQYMAVYLQGVYADPALSRWFQAEYKRRGKKLDMGKSCVRFRSLDELPLDLIGEVIARVGVDDYLARYEAVHAKPAAKKPAAKKPAAKKPAARKPAAKKPAVKQPARASAARARRA